MGQSITNRLIVPQTLKKFLNDIKQYEEYEFLYIIMWIIGGREDTNSKR